MSRVQILPAPPLLNVKRNGARASIQEYETGLVIAILPKAMHFYAKRRSLGDDVSKPNMVEERTVRI